VRGVFVGVLRVQRNGEQHPLESFVRLGHDFGDDGLAQVGAERVGGAAEQGDFVSGEDQGRGHGRLLVEKGCMGFYGLQSACRAAESFGPPF